MRERQVVMFTGASAGVGRATAIAFARRRPESVSWPADVQVWRPHAEMWKPQVDESRDFGARGRFDSRARRSSWQLWATQHRATLGASAMAAGLFGVAAVVSRTASHREE